MMDQDQVWCVVAAIYRSVFAAHRAGDHLLASDLVRDVDYYCSLVPLRGTDPAVVAVMDERRAARGL